MKRLQKAAALVLALVVVFSASVVPAHAEEYVSRADIFAWIASQGKIGSIISQITGVGCPKNEDGRHVAHSCVYDGVAGHYVCTCDSCGDTFVATKSELHDAYDSHVGDMPVNGIDSAGAFYWKPSVFDLTPSPSASPPPDYVELQFFKNSLSAQWTNDDIDSGEISSKSTKYVDVLVASTDTGFRLKLMPPNESMQRYGHFGDSSYDKYLPYASISAGCVVPVSGTYTRLVSPFVDAVYTDTSGGSALLKKDWREKSFGHVSSGTCININTGSYELDNSIYCTGVVMDVSAPVFKVVPDSAFASDLYTPDTRPGTITGKYLVQNGDAYEDSSTTIINEDDNSIYNPVTNTTTNYDSWSYDYSTRTYTMTDNTNNSTTTVTYGDENITINEGGNTYNVYYGTVINNNGGGDDSGGNGGGSDSGSSGDTSIIAKLGEMLGTLVSGLLGGVTAFVSAVFDGLISLANVISDKFGQVVSAVLSWFAQIPELFAGFSAFLVAVFPFLPADVMLLLTFGLAAVVFIAIIKAIRR